MPPEVNGSLELQRGWRLIVACCTGVICSSIVLPYYSIGALVVPVTESFGWSRAQFQSAILFSSGLGALTAPLVGWLIDRYGVRRVGLPGLAGLSVGFAIAATMDGALWLLYLAYGSMAILGAGTIPVTWTRSITHNFFRRRGLALGLTLTGTGICAALVPHYVVFLVEQFGWRAAYVGLALIPVLVGLPVVFLWLRDLRADSAPPAELAPETGITVGQAARGYRFWVLLCSILLAYMGFSGIGPNLFPALTDDGFSSTDAASVASVFGLSIMAGRVIVGYLVDRFWAPGVAFAALLMPVVGSWWFTASPGFVEAACATFLIGFAAGAELDLMSFLAARYFGLKHYGKIYSVLYAALAVCSGTAPMLFAWVFDQTSSYDLGFAVAAGFFACASLMVLALGRYPTLHRAEASPSAGG